jgi:hypothetical protein
MASASARHPSLRILGRAGAVAVAACASIVLVALPASADCGLLDPGCIEETVNGTLEDPAGTVNGTVDETVDTVTGTAAGIVDQVGGLLGPLGEDPPGNGGGGGSGGGGGGGGNPATPPVGGGPGRGPAGLPHDVPGDAPTAAPGSVTVPGETAGGDAPGSSIGIPAPAPEAGLLDRIGGTVGGVARRLAFPMALAVLVMLFAALQNRMDRNDPRMARAPVVPDVMRFG